MIKEKNKNFEYTIFTCVLFLAVFGLIVLYSASSVSSTRLYDSTYYLFIRQSIICGIGIILSLLISFIPYKIYSKFSKYIFLTCLMLVVMTAFAGRISRGSSRWIVLRGIIFQPSELMKLAMIIYLAKVLSEIKGDFEKKDNFVRVLLVSYVPTFIVALSNLSTGIILFIIATTMIFTVSRKKLIFIFIITIIVLFYMFAYPMSKVLQTAGLLKNYQVGRIFAWKDPENNPDIAYQTLQGIYAIGSGRIFGRGYLSSIQKAIIPEAQNDMIFAILCEEFGLAGALLLIVLYVVLIYRILIISFRQKSMNAMLLVFGIAVHIAIQVILNIGVVTNLLPNTGVVLPFVSYGGSSLIVLYMEIGIVMSVVRSEKDIKV